MGGFSDKMRDSLGATGATIGVAIGDGSVHPGDAVHVEVTVTGGSNPATVDGVVVRIVEAQRHWTTDDGTRLEEDEAEAGARRDRGPLTAAWTRRTAHERRFDLGVTVESGASHVATLEVVVPSDCRTSSVSCNHTVVVQADIKGQIDPTGQAKLVLA